LYWELKLFDRFFQVSNANFCLNSAELGLKIPDIGTDRLSVGSAECKIRAANAWSAPG